MAIHRMRTVEAALAEIRSMDPKTAMTCNCIRTLCKTEQVRCVYTGCKILVDLDNLRAYIGNEEDCTDPKD